MSRPLIPGLWLLRGVAVLALLLLLWNPARSRRLPDDAQPLVLLDASLSMTGGGRGGSGGPWRAALDTARAASGRGGAIIWRFGATVAGFDTAPPADGASRLGPALEAAAARGGAVTAITDGAIQDVLALPADIVRRPRIVVLPRPVFRDGFVASITGPRRVGALDSVRLTVAYGTAGVGEPAPSRGAGGTGERAVLTVRLGERRIASRPVVLPDSGTVATELTVPASRLPSGWTALEVRLDDRTDEEPRDDARWFVLEVSPEPAAVILAAPPDWETRFLARTLEDVARVPVRTFVETAPDREGGWRDGSTLQPVTAGDVQRAVTAARLVVLGGDPARFGRVRVPARSAVLTWATAAGEAGDWYVQPPPASPLAGMLAGLPWDSLPPASSAQPLEPDSATAVVLTARLARRGAARPLVLLRERGAGAARQATIAATGLWRWSFRGGAAALAYRSLVASLTDWLLGGGAGSGERFTPETLETPNGLPLRWRWTGTAAPPAGVAVGFQVGGVVRRDTLRFDATGHADLRLPPGAYRYAAADGGGERGVVVVETYSDEWRPARPALQAQPGLSADRLEQVGLRDRWWLFVIAVGALVAEWAWRRRVGLP